LQKHTKTSHQLIVRHFDKVGVLASVLNVLQQADINIEEMNNTIFKSGEAAVATLSLNKQPEANVLAQLEAMEDKIIQVMLV
jgi:D-3-phosphoglycerate dehydrogenase